MDLTQEEKQRNEFRELLYSLSVSQESLRNQSEREKIYTRLENLYYDSEKKDYFRHFYSDIFSVLTTVKQGDRDGSVDVLGQNLSEIRKGYQAKHHDADGNIIDISDSIKKLYDHVSLDIARMGYSDAADRQVSQESSIKNIQTQVTTLKETSTEVSTQMKSIGEDIERAKNAQKEYIAILGIFAAVVLAFTGGIAFSTSVLQNLHVASIYRVLIVSIVIGLVLVNILYGLFYYVDRLVNKKDERRIKPFWPANIILLVLLIVVTIAWYHGVAEGRDLRVGSTTARIEYVYSLGAADSYL